MISVIISSANNELLEKVKINIAETIGVPFEILAFKNHQGEKGICEIYNMGAKQAQYNILCFTHEDICLTTQNWGMAIVSTFTKDDRIGLIGIAGSNYKSAAPSGWWHPNKAYNNEFYHIIQGSKTDEKDKEHQNHNPAGVSLPRVAVIDGVWFCTKRNIALESPFDEAMLSGFHCYDVDYSLNVGRNYNIVITYDVLLEHFSEGHYSKSWLSDTLKLHKKWKNVLPVNLANLSNQQLYNNEKIAFKQLLSTMALYNYSRLSMLKTLVGYHTLYQKFGCSLFFSLLAYLLKLKRNKSPE